MAKRVLIKDLEAEIKFLKDAHILDVGALEDITEGLIESKRENTHLIKKIFALESTLETISNAALTGQQIAELP